MTYTLYFTGEAKKDLAGLKKNEPAKQKFNVLIRPVIKKYHFPEGDVLAFYVPLSDKKPVYYNHPY